MEIKKQSLIDWSVELNRKTVAWIGKEYLKGNSGPYLYRANVFCFLAGERIRSRDNIQVHTSFKEAKKFIIDLLKVAGEI